MEQMVLPSLARGGYKAESQVIIGARPGGGPHKVDAIAERNGRKVIISLK